MTNNTPTITRDGVIGQDGSEVVTVDQATGAEFARYPVAGKEEAAAAVAAARSSTGPWWDLGFEGRAERLRAWRREIAVGGEEGTALIHAENGKPLDEARVEVLGPVPLPTQIPIIREHIQDALDRGATATVGGIEAVGERYVTPTILVGVSPDALAVTEETFGPTLAVVKVTDTEEAIAHINGGRYGLGSAVFSRDRGEAIARQLRVGMTSINDALVFSINPAVPFGGRGDSGYGRKQGDEGLREFAYPHSFTAKTGPAQFSATTFGRPAGAMAGALAGVRNRILAEGSEKTDPTS
ncbi:MULTISPECIES: aldehyde dehydrogenase family protein [unclassified Streptomyces]|uniref:aldehyde dehydrogenase family protein n=1 Tax=unclassified Streptomyces TaxID=2593676 RepID=UPI00382977E5